MQNKDKKNAPKQNYSVKREVDDVVHAVCMQACNARSTHPLSSSSSVPTQQPSLRLFPHSRRRSTHQKMSLPLLQTPQAPTARRWSWMELGSCGYGIWRPHWGRQQQMGCVTVLEKVKKEAWPRNNRICALTKEGNVTRRDDQRRQKDDEWRRKRTNEGG